MKAVNKKKFALFILLFFLALLYTYYLRPITDDELFNYGFASNIVHGSIPYVDFNMIVPPFFHYLLAILLVVFGQHLLVYHVCLALMIVVITWISSRKIGMRAVALYALMLIYPYTGYNMVCLLLFMILLWSIDKRKSTSDVLEAILISMMFLTKQTLGILVIPSFIYSKSKKKTFFVYLVSICLLVLYLMIHNNLFQFIDYCILGMFDFTSKNYSGWNTFLVLEMFIILSFLILSLKTRKKEYFYILCFQIITFPTVDYFHFAISFIPVMYILLVHVKKNFIGNLFLIGFSISYLLILTFGMWIKDFNYLYLEHYSEPTFMKGRLTYRVTDNYINDINNYLKKYEGYHPYILGNFSYLIKLNSNLSIDKYDIINNGNMGYLGWKRYIDEIERDCKVNKCVFIINDEEARTLKVIQTNREILRYVQENYEQKYASNIFSVYVTSEIILKRSNT